MTRTRRLQALPASGIDDAREALETGDYARALQISRRLATQPGPHSAEASLVAARAHLRADAPRAALEILRSRRDWPTSVRVTAQILLGISEQRSGVRGGISRIERAYADAASPQQRTEAAYYRAWAAYRDRDLTDALQWAQTSLDEAESSREAALAHGLVGWIEEARNDYAASAQAFRSALRSLRAGTKADGGLRASVLQNLAVFGAELPDSRLTELVEREWPNMRSSVQDGTRAAVVQTAIHLGVGAANSGNFDDALDRFEEAIVLSKERDELAAAAQVEAADVLQMIGEETSARRALRRVLEFMRGKRPPEIEGQMPFLEAACVAGRLQPPKAAECIARYAAIAKLDDGRWALSGDRRVEILEQHARGLAEAAAGRRDAGLATIASARDAWRDLGYLRRAARAQADLRLLGRSEDNVVTALLAASAPNHPLAREIPNTNLKKTSWPPLTPVLDEVLRDLCSGKSVAEISEQTGRAQNTLRNHIKRLFKLFEVNSTAGLIVKAMASSTSSRRAKRQSSRRR